MVVERTNTLNVDLTNLAQFNSKKHFIKIAEKGGKVRLECVKKNFFSRFSKFFSSSYDLDKVAKKIMEYVRDNPYYQIQALKKNTGLQNLVEKLTQVKLRNEKTLTAYLWLDPLFGSDNDANLSFRNYASDVRATAECTKKIYNRVSECSKAISDSLSKCSNGQPIMKKNAALTTENLADINNYVQLTFENLKRDMRKIKNSRDQRFLDKKVEFRAP